MKSFSNWTIAEVDKEFQIKQQYDCGLLNSWLASADQKFDGAALSPADSLKYLQSRLIRHVYDWNDQELMIQCIGPLLNLVDFNQEYYQPFYKRVVSAPYKNEKLAGVVDFLVAQGLRVPEQPYFFIHEHKKDTDSPSDPLGQVMIAMMAAQILNKGKYPIYGAYIMGSHWIFLVLSGQEYGVSLAYNATKDEINDIYFILKKVKAIIDELVQ